MDQTLIDNQLRAVADPTRRAILHQLATGRELSANEVASGFDISRPAVSRHLRLLLESELISVRSQAQSRLFKTNAESIKDLRAWFDGYWEGALPKLKAAVELDIGKNRKRSDT